MEKIGVLLQNHLIADKNASAFNNGRVKTLVQVILKLIG